MEIVAAIAVLAVIVAAAFALFFRYQEKHQHPK
jgi:type II secretory pathway component PulJ